MKLRPTLLAALLLLPLIQCTIAPADGAVSVKLELFGNALDMQTLDFFAAGTREDATLSLQTGLLVDECTFNISGSPHTPGGKDCPANLSLDMGANGAVDWAFCGTGYGRLGHQTLLQDDRDNASFQLAPAGTGNANFYLPKGARVSSASVSVNGSPAPTTVSLTGGTASTTIPFNSVAAYRCQWLYNSTEVGRSGIVDKLYFKWGSGAGPLTFSNFRLTLCNTTVSSLSTTFANNYGGATPVRVVNSASYTVNNDTSQWIPFEVPNTFHYNNTKHLLVEVAFNGVVGAGFSIRAGTITGAPGVRRVYDSGTDVGTTGTAGAAGYRYDFKLDLVTNFSLKADVGADSNLELETNSTSWNSSSLIITQALAAYVPGAATALTDQFGNTLVRIPLSFTLQYGGNITVSGLDVSYDWMARVGPNPHNGNITNELNALLPDEPGTTNVSVIIRLNSLSPGKVTISNLTLLARPPSHVPQIDAVYPANPASVSENSTLPLRVECSDIYNWPLTYRWLMDGAVIPDATAAGYNYTPDFDSAGKHVFIAEVSNGFSTLRNTWNVSVRNINRPPFVISASPDARFTMKENTTAAFGVNATDPDGDALKYLWAFDGSQMTDSTGPSFNLTADFRMAGIHTLDCSVSDSSSPVPVQWKITVENVNAPPMIDTFSPRTAPSIKEGDSQHFSITASDIDNQVILVEWFLDGDYCGNGEQYSYRPNFTAAGAHDITVTVSDGELESSMGWSVSVNDLNRLPQPVIDAPNPSGNVFADTQAISFLARTSRDPDEDTLTYKWTEGTQTHSTRRDFNRTFPAGDHTVVLEVDDGRGGVNATSVSFTVVHRELVVTVVFSPASPVAGDRVSLNVKIVNRGTVTEPLPLRLQIDGTDAGARTLADLLPGTEATHIFSWNAAEGSHTVTVWITDGAYNSTLVVAQNPATAGGAGATMIYGGLAVGLLAGAGIMVFAISRRKRSGPGQAPAPAQGPVLSPAPYEYAQDIQTSVRPRQYFDSPDTAGQYPVDGPNPAEFGQSPVTREETEKKQRISNKVDKLITQVSERLDGIEADGKAANDARRTLELTRTLVRTGDPAKALKYARRAEGIVRAALAIDPSASGKEDAPETAGAPAVSRQDYDSIPDAIPVPPRQDVRDGPTPPRSAGKKVRSDRKQQPKAARVLEQVTELIDGLEASGKDVGVSRNSLRLARTYFKAANYAKVIECARDAEIASRPGQNKVEAQVRVKKVARPIRECPECATEVEPEWKACPNCAARLG